MEIADAPISKAASAPAPHRVFFIFIPIANFVANSLSFI
jgi:hypothetical protein